MANDTTKIVSGPADFQLKPSGGAFATVGVVGDVRVEIENVTREEVGEPYGPTPHNYFHETHRVRVVVPIKQTTREHLEYCIGSRGGAGYGYFEDRPGRRAKFGLKVIPIASQGGGGTDPVGNFVYLYSAVCREIGPLMYSRDGERVFEATFDACIDTDRDAGRRIGEYNLTDN
jgi:hypothetical protein